MSLADVLGFFFTSHNFSVINCCRFPWLTCSMSVAQYASGFILFRDIPSYVDLSFLTQRLSSQAKPKSRHSELFIV